MKQIHPLADPKLGKTAETVIILILQSAEIFINRIKDEYARTTITDFNDGLQAIIRALADADPDDKEQIRQIIDDFLRGSDFADNTTEELLKKVAKLKDDRLRGILTALVPVSFDVIKHLFDEVPNEEQIRMKLKAALSGPQGIALIENILLFVVKDPNTARTLATLIVSLLTTVIQMEIAAEEASK